MEKKSNLIQEGSNFTFTAQEANKGQRVDKFIASHLSDYSRSFLHKLFDKKQVIINTSKQAKPGNALKPGDIISISFPKEESTVIEKDIPTDLGVKVIAQEKDFLIIYKPAGLVVHPPNETCQEVTLTDWLKEKYDDIAHVGSIDRPGIVHRLDRETSGLMIVSKTNQAHAAFTDMFKERKIQKTYLAIVAGQPEKEGTIDFYIGRHPVVRNKMHHFTQLTKQVSSRSATSHYKVKKYYNDYSLVEVKPITGRTHQIRVHLAAINHPIIADPLYGQKSKSLKRHALHAHSLEFELNGKAYNFTSPLDKKLQSFLDQSECLVSL